ncbi:MAG: methyl-accepting chemotaxis protein [candidate division NC10 bacterium]|nr:methyl-accepting chemotaxis protein [candidate division NC10 bacterium]
MKGSIGNKILLGFLAVIATTAALGGGLAVLLPNIPSRDAISAFSALLVGALLAKVLSARIAREVGALALASKVLSEGDLTKDVAVHSDDELGALAAAFNQMVLSLRSIVREAKATAEKVTASATALSGSAEQMNASTEEIGATVEQIAKGAEHQAELVEKTSKVMREMASAINEIANRAKSAAEAAAEAGYTAQSGGRSAQDRSGPSWTSSRRSRSRPTSWP